MVMVLAFLLAQSPTFDASTVTMGVARTVATVETGRSPASLGGSRGRPTAASCTSPR